MKVMFINGSPRKNWNTDILMKKALDGVVSAGAEAEMVYLYDLKFRARATSTSSSANTT